jgi:hypothetical protein
VAGPWPRRAAARYGAAAVPLRNPFRAPMPRAAPRQPPVAAGPRSGPGGAVSPSWADPGDRPSDTAVLAPPHPAVRGSRQPAARARRPLPAVPAPGAGEVPPARPRPAAPVPQARHAARLLSPRPAGRVPPRRAARARGHRPVAGVPVRPRAAQTPSACSGPPLRCAARAPRTGPAALALPRSAAGAPPRQSPPAPPRLSRSSWASPRRVTSLSHNSSILVADTPATQTCVPSNARTILFYSGGTTFSRRVEQMFDV